VLCRSCFQRSADGVAKAPAETMTPLKFAGLQESEAERPGENAL
jgi:hypothetical protein